jgi:hypothetical protein
MSNKFMFETVDTTPQLRRGSQGALVYLTWWGINAANEQQNQITRMQQESITITEILLRKQILLRKFMSNKK